jgi:hypothetical protein
MVENIYTMDGNWHTSPISRLPTEPVKHYLHTTGPMLVSLPRHLLINSGMADLEVEVGLKITGHLHLGQESMEYVV